MRKYLLVIMLLFFSINIFASEQEIVPWQSVVGGDVVAPPKLTSYGFISISDGRILNASTEQGAIIWREHIKGKPSQFFSVTDSDFIYITTDNATKLSLYNPDGTFLWQIELESPTISDPFPGKDGRVFVQEKNAISCYGTMGTMKWRLELPTASNLPLIELNDGSILYVQAQPKEGTSVAIRVSPYGEKIEEIKFFDIITILKSHEDGVIIGFENGLVGSCSVVENELIHTWSAESSNSNLTPIDIIRGETGFCVIFSNGLLREYSFTNQEIFWESQLPQNFITQEIYSRYVDNGYVFATSKNATYFSSQKSGFGGQKEWEKTITYTGNAFFPIVTQSGYLVLSHDNWVIAGYKLADFSEKRIKEKEKNSKEYVDFYPPNQQTWYDIQKLLFSLQGGSYGVLEAEYKNFLDYCILEFQLEYMNSKKNMDFASKSKAYVATSFFESSHYNYVIPLILENEIDSYFITLALQIAANIAYDPNGIMLESIKNYYFEYRTRLSEGITIEVINAVYSICKYMGDVAFLDGGKEILFDIYEHNKNLKVQREVQKTLNLFIKFEK